ncbi:hypothetical protein ODJ79_38150 [Actinoplanes sp. KI2]|uniref:hypothetical protein n=1 Tax=Actinoplanes sp. KI2 TaxID=2983315 RepID=UPI0021D5E5E3|nr:hypothetical protein [Actinoplanes sp. KI2]MCU7729574.1 hypothetical protein [Actinoplanes sp. KI2]
MLEIHDLLPVSWQLAVPEAVRGRLLDMGTACNRAALAADQAYLQQRYAAAEIDSAAACADGGWYRTGLAHQLLDCAVSFGEQITAVYTVTAATFVAYATLITAIYAAWGYVPPSEPAVTLPSRLLRAPAAHLPLVQMPVGAGTRQAVVDHNDELAAAHRRLMHAIERTARSHPLDVYDHPSRVAGRPALSVGLSVDLACGMHAYAANCVWALGLATRRDDD